MLPHRGLKERAVSLNSWADPQVPANSSACTKNRFSMGILWNRFPSSTPPPVYG